jgi:hypothetical protein
LGSRALTLVEGRFLMEANRKTTRRRVRREIRRMGTRFLSLVEGRFLMEANRKTTRIRVRRRLGGWEPESSLGRGKVLYGGQQEDHQKKGEEGDHELGTRVLTMVEGWFMMEANRKTTKRRVGKEIRRTGTRVLTLAEGRFLMEIRRIRTKASLPCLREGS